MPTFAVLQCVNCEWEIYAEVLGKGRWDGSCPKCKVNAWTFSHWSTDLLAPMQFALHDAGIDAAFVKARKPSSTKEAWKMRGCCATYEDPNQPHVSTCATKAGTVP